MIEVKMIMKQYSANRFAPNGFTLYFDRKILRQDDLLELVLIILIQIIMTFNFYFLPYTF